MLKIVLPIVAMIVGVAAGVFIGARRRGPQSDASGPSPFASGLGLARRLLVRFGGWGIRTARRASGLARRLPGELQGLTQSARSRLPRVSRPAPQAGGHPALPATGNGAQEAAAGVGRSPETRRSDKSDGAVNLGMLNCRARIGREPKGDTWQTVLILDICGTIEAPDENHEVGLKTTLSDVTDNKGQTPLPVPVRPKQGPINRAVSFTYQTEIGKLCRQRTVLEDWMTVAQISPEWFVLPRQGHRELRFSVAIISQSTGQELAAGSCVGAFENLEIGYLDVDDNIQRAKTLAVGLAFSVGAANNALREPETNVIYGWVRTNFGSGDASEGARLELEQALRKTAGFFLKGGRLNLEEICNEIVEIAPMVGRLDIMDLCLRVAGAKGQVTASDIGLLKDLAQWLKIDRTRLRAMVEKTLPVSMHQSEDAEMILGVTTEMSKDEVRHQLNREYAKWSSRVISSDPAIRKQADQMLNLIANARTQYIGVRPSE
jgi:hypothetical protein